MSTTPSRALFAPSSNPVSTQPLSGSLNTPGTEPHVVLWDPLQPQTKVEDRTCQLYDVTIGRPSHTAVVPCTPPNQPLCAAFMGRHLPFEEDESLLDTTHRGPFANGFFACALSHEVPVEDASSRRGRSLELASVCETDDPFEPMISDAILEAFQDVAEPHSASSGPTSVACNVEFAQTEAASEEASKLGSYLVDPSLCRTPPRPAAKKAICHKTPDTPPTPASPPPHVKVSPQRINPINDTHIVDFLEHKIRAIARNHLKPVGDAAGVGGKRLRSQNDESLRLPSDIENFRRKSVHTLMALPGRQVKALCNEAKQSSADKKGRWNLSSPQEGMGTTVLTAHLTSTPGSAKKGATLFPLKGPGIYTISGEDAYLLAREYLSHLLDMNDANDPLTFARYIQARIIRQPQMDFEA